MNRVKLFTGVFFTFFIIQSCKPKGAGDAAKNAAVKAAFGIDESLQPIVDQEAYVFIHLDTTAKPVIHYRSESEVVNLLLNDSLRFVILSRELTANETKVLTGRNLPPQTHRFAIDAVALIVNQASKDTLITVADLKKILNGENKTDKKIVFDNPNSSLVRYLKTFAGVNELKTKSIYSLKNSKEVIRYISQNQDAIGVVGFSWLGDPDQDYAEAVKKVKAMGIRDEASKTAPSQYFTPSQNTLALKQYPLMRGLYVINCTGRLGLGTDFEHYILSEGGQRIILRSGLLPDSIPPREINIKHTF